MYMKDKAVRVTLRLNEEQFNFVKRNADVLGVSPSEFLRMVVNSTMSASKQITEKLDDYLEGASDSEIEETSKRMIKLLKGGQGRENDKASINDIV